jgi:hypothetical protein
MVYDKTQALLDDYNVDDVSNDSDTEDSEEE